MKKDAHVEQTALAPAAPVAETPAPAATPPAAEIAVPALPAAPPNGTPAPAPIDNTTARAELDKQRYAPFPLPRPEDLPTLPTVGLDILTLARLLAASGFFTDVKTVSQSVAKILAGQEVGVGPMRAMTDLHVITDNSGRTRISMAAVLMGSLIKRSGKYEYEVVKLDEAGCSLQFYRMDLGTKNFKPIGEPVTFTEIDAKRAKVYDRNPTYQAYPRNMYFARALSNGARWHCADIFGGPIYTPEELRDLIAEEEAVATTPAAAVVPGNGEAEAAGTRSDQVAARLKELHAAPADAPTPGAIA